MKKSTDHFSLNYRCFRVKKEHPSAIFPFSLSSQNKSFCNLLSRIHITQYIIVLPPSNCTCLLRIRFSCRHKGHAFCWSELHLIGHWIGVLGYSGSGKYQHRQEVPLIELLIFVAGSPENMRGCMFSSCRNDVGSGKHRILIMFSKVGLWWCILFVFLSNPLAGCEFSLSKISFDHFFLEMLCKLVSDR